MAANFIPFLPGQINYLLPQILADPLLSPQGLGNGRRADTQLVGQIFQSNFPHIFEIS